MDLPAPGWGLGRLGRFIGAGSLLDHRGDRLRSRCDWALRPQLWQLSSQSRTWVQTDWIALRSRGSAPPSSLKRRNPAIMRFRHFDRETAAGNQRCETGNMVLKGTGKMTSRRESVVLQGILRGEGHERSCRVRAIKVAMPCEPMASEYADMDIADSDNFPDGSYEVTVAGRTIPLTRREGFYLARQ